MSEISIIGNSLSIRLDDVHNIRSIQKFLANRMGFRLRGTLWVSNNVAAENIIAVREYIQSKGGNVILDDICQQTVQEFQTIQQGFENRREEAREIKDSPDNSFGELPIQEFGINPRTGQRWELMNYQRKPVLHALAAVNSANFSVPGAGKTWMAYATYFLAKERQNNPQVNRLLVVCPKPAFQVWEGEYKTITENNPEEFNPEDNIYRITEDTEPAIIPFLPDNYEIILINYEKVRNQRYEAALNAMLGRYDFFLLLDESHKIKGYETFTGTAIRELANQARRRMILTGTPMPNLHIGLWNQFEFLFPNENLLGEYDIFKKRVKNNEGEQRRTERTLYPFFTRVTDNQLDLPETRPVIVQCPMEITQQKIYDTIAHRILINEANRRQINAFEQWERNITYLIMAATDPGLFSENHQYMSDLIDLGGVELEELITRYSEGELAGKIQDLRSFLNSDVNLDEEKIIIWCNFRGTLTKVQDMIEQEFGVGVRKIDGSPELSLEDKERSLREFRGETGETEVNVLIANPASLAESVSLHQVCHHAIYVDRTFNATHWIQSKKRIHRVGMDDVVTRYTILKSTFADSDDQTVDERIRRSLLDKERRMNQFLNDPGINENEMELNWNENGTGGNDYDDYAGLLESQGPRYTNNPEPEDDANN
jgi:SNF2 family DNA or RNA helicase